MIETYQIGVSLVLEGDIVAQLSPVAEAMEKLSELADEGARRITGIGTALNALWRSAETAERIRSATETIGLLGEAALKISASLEAMRRFAGSANAAAEKTGTIGAAMERVEERVTAATALMDKYAAAAKAAAGAAADIGTPATPPRVPIPTVAGMPGTTADANQPTAESTPFVPAAPPAAVAGAAANEANGHDVSIKPVTAPNAPNVNQLATIQATDGIPLVPAGPHGASAQGADSHATEADRSGEPLRAALGYGMLGSALLTGVGDVFKAGARMQDLRDWMRAQQVPEEKIQQAETAAHDVSEKDGIPVGPIGAMQAQVDLMRMVHDPELARTLLPAYLRFATVAAASGHGDETADLLNQADAGKLSGIIDPAHPEKLAQLFEDLRIAMLNAHGPVVSETIRDVTQAGTDTYGKGYDDTKAQSSYALYAKHNPAFAPGRMHAAVEDWLASFASKEAMNTAISVMNGVAEALNALSSWASANPETSAQLLKIAAALAVLSTTIGSAALWMFLAAPLLNALQPGAAPLVAASAREGAEAGTKATAAAAPAEVAVAKPGVLPAAPLVELGLGQALRFVLGRALLAVAVAQTAQLSQAYIDDRHDADLEPDERERVRLQRADRLYAANACMPWRLGGGKKPEGFDARRRGKHGRMVAGAFVLDAYRPHPAWAGEIVPSHYRDDEYRDTAPVDIRKPSENAIPSPSGDASKISMENISISPLINMLLGGALGGSAAPTGDAGSGSAATRDALKINVSPVINVAPTITLQGSVQLDGQSVGTFTANSYADAAGLPPAGPTGFDPRATPLSPGRNV